ncbi:MAG TPA: hypothetical protein VFM23_03600 [Gemmatimonadales bacterium]|nr:hypothetical protein [Gemmatimonadales bacterium]
MKLLDQIAARPVEALVVEQDALVRALRMTLEELHARRRCTPQMMGELNLDYIEAVFGWIKEAGGGDLVIMKRGE